MSQHSLNEDNHPEKLFVGYSAKINDKIAAIKVHNSKNQKAITQLDEHIDYLRERYTSLH